VDEPRQPEPDNEKEEEKPENAPDGEKKDKPNDAPEGEPEQPETAPENEAEAPEASKQPEAATEDGGEAPEASEQPETATEDGGEAPETAKQPEATPTPPEPERPPRTFYSVLIKYGVIQNIGLFKARSNIFSRGDQCVIKTERGLEIGEALTNAELIEENNEIETVGNVIRRATENDLRKVEEINSNASVEEHKYCVNKIHELKLPMKLAMVEHLFGGDKIIFYFLSDGRVDFRDLVKELAREYRTRIEMRQIGVRDEAKIVADYEHCGREICCRTFLRSLDPVTMKMAKNQKATLDPAKISGACGRLMCCLRYEDPVYADLKNNLPKKGSILKHKGNTGLVLDVDIMSESVRFAEKDGDVGIVHRRELRGECLSAGGGDKIWRDGKYVPDTKPSEEFRARIAQNQREFNEPTVRTDRPRPKPRPKPAKPEPSKSERPKAKTAETKTPEQRKEQGRGPQRPRKRRRRGSRGRRPPSGQDGNKGGQAPQNKKE
jgi:cell fate regulator YaaT (PSP1 superfamily)